MPSNLDVAKESHPSKFVTPGKAFDHIRRGDQIFVGAGCGEPRHLVNVLMAYVDENPGIIIDVELYTAWATGINPAMAKKYSRNFRLNSFFLGKDEPEIIRQGLADYTPILSSQIPDLFRRKFIMLDVALIQVSPPDQHGFMSLGVSVDVTRAAVDAAKLIIAQVNRHMPRVPGDGYIHLDEVDFLIEYDEPLPEFPDLPVDDEVIRRIGRHVSYLVNDGDTIQVGYGSTPNAILPQLKDKRHLGIHTEVLSAGLVRLIEAGVVDNSHKTRNRGRTVASFCQGTTRTYDFVHENPTITLRNIDYTNDPLVIASHDNMIAIGSATEIDLTGQATAESLAGRFFRGVGGQIDFVRGAALSNNGRAILALPSTAQNGQISRIVPWLQEGAGVTFGRGDVQYVVTEYGIAYLHGKNIRERAMELIAIAHPKFKPWLIEEAKKLGFIFKDQKFIPGERGEYPDHLVSVRTTRSGLELTLRPVAISDEPLLKDFFYSLSDDSLYSRFASPRRDMPHEMLQEFVVIDYSQDMALLATVHEGKREVVVGMGEYVLDPKTRLAEVAFAVQDGWQGQGIGSQLVAYIALLAKKKGLRGLTASVLAENRAMLTLFERMDVEIEKHWGYGMVELTMLFR